jgi:azurin
MKQFVFTSLLLTSVLAFTGCGGSGSSETAAPAAPAKSASSAKAIKVTGNDQMRFNLTEIKVKAGATVVIEMSNIGKLPAAAMSHNFVVLNRPVTAEEFTTFATASSQNPPTYIAKDTDLVLVHTKMLGPGESATIEFTAPSTPGEYDFLCTFPGHYVTMHGKLIVE